METRFATGRSGPGPSAMTLSEQLGPEAMRDSSFLTTSLAEVARFGGTAPHFAGDGFMALFGAPVAQEDHGAARAFGGARDPTRSQRSTIPPSSRPQILRSWKSG